ncbi:MAG: hypothetical protein ACFBRM_06570 [Pikeienuella sp.]
MSGEIPAGRVTIDRATAAAVALFLDDPDAEPTVIFAATEGGDAALWHFAEARYRATLAIVKRRLGSASLEVTRTRGHAPAPPGLRADWARAALWELDTGGVIVALSGAPSKALFVVLSRGAFQ